MCTFENLNISTFLYLVFNHVKYVLAGIDMVDVRW